jgi:hypothetical protein
MRQRGPWRSMRSVRAPGQGQQPGPLNAGLEVAVILCTGSSYARALTRSHAERTGPARTATRCGAPASPSRHRHESPVQTVGPRLSTLKRETMAAG